MFFFRVKNTGQIYVLLVVQFDWRFMAQVQHPYEDGKNGFK